MQKSTFLWLALGAALASPAPLLAQVNPAYEVATWRGFKAAAVTYTFDDNTSNQLPVALPLFDQYNFKTTLFTVTSWGPNWAGLRTASANGHEVTSHTVTHPSLGPLTVAQQITELQQSQATIKANVPTAKCETVAYPNCVTGDLPTIQTYYIAGRVCSGQIMPATPPDFYNLSAIITGTTGSVQTAANFNAKVDAAKTAKGWCVFLTHGINADGGYSPTQSSELATHLAYVNANSADFWVSTFSDVVKYIKERNAVALSETTITPDQLLLTVSHTLGSAVYDVPVTFRRQLPATWPSAKLTKAGAAVASTIVTVNNVRYVVFDAVPNQGDITLAKDNVLAVTPGAAMAATDLWPNPLADKGTLARKGAFSYAVYALDGKLLEAGQGTDVVKFGGNLAAGTYIVKISQQGQVSSVKFSKK
ncbi:MAG: T9SS type A sorting domain-containing protein [Hymenobacter sp.]|nr:MAG: T9SS type A sorting domain-containing protein [Hymenobacter sp.]